MTQDFETAPDAGPGLRFVELHGRRMAYRYAPGPAPDAPVVLLVHGMAGSSATWSDVIDDLAEHFTVLAPDLLGHGSSARFRGDYSLGNQASFLRDLLAVVGVSSATFVGQSLGGGVVMQAAYQYPQLVERLVLVDSGGLGRHVSTLLKLLALPGSGLVLTGVTAEPIRAVIDGVRGALRRVGFELGPEEAQMLLAFESLADAKTRKAFLATLRSVVDHTGQRVSAHDRLHLAADRVPVMVMWGDRDPIIPIHHAHSTVDLLPDARLEIFEGAGHFPQNHQPRRFARAIVDFVGSTPAAHVTEDSLIDLLQG